MLQTAETLDVSRMVTLPTGDPTRVSAVGSSLKGSEILRIAAEIRSRIAAGERVCNLTVGDFDPKQFRIPIALENAIVDALRQGETNYPPSLGLPSLREAIQGYYERYLGLRYPLDAILVTSGSRPGVYGTYRTLVSPGERVVYPVPSWNNNYYCDMIGAESVPIATKAADAFMPTRAQIEPHIRSARMIALNSPVNPCGTVFTAEALGAICDLVLEENARRGAGRPVYLMYDHVYWQLTFGTTEHVDPVSLRPEMARYTIFIDGISKAFAATGVRVGWVIGPTDVIAPMNNFLGHVGTWAPRAEQVAAAKVLGMPDELGAFRTNIIAGVQRRLDALYNGISALKTAGHPVDAVAPMGAIYLSARFDLLGKRTPDGALLQSSEDVRKWLLLNAAMGVVPFEAFGADDIPGWFRLSVGAATMEDIGMCLSKLATGLAGLG